MTRRFDPSELLALLSGGLAAPSPLPSLIKQARKLPVDKKGVWLLLTPRLSLPGLDAQGHAPTLVILLDMVGRELLYQDMPEDVNTADLARLVLETMLDPQPIVQPGGAEADGNQPQIFRIHSDAFATPVQPARLLAPDAYVAQSLAAELSGLKVKVTHDDSPETAQMLAALVGPYQAAVTAQAEAMRALPVLTDQDDDAVRAFHAAMQDFCQLRAWEVFDPLKLVRATWTDEHGQARQCCASVMGDGGASAGLALYARADEWAVLAQSSGPETALRALSGMERVELAGEGELAPEDLAALQRLGLERTVAGNFSGWPVLQRLSLVAEPEAEVTLRTMPPVTPLHAVTALLRAMADRARARPGRAVTSLTAEVEGVRVRYPSPPADDFSAQERRGAVRISIDGASEWNHSAPEHLTLTAPASMTLRDVWSGVEKKYGRFLLPFRLEFKLAGEGEDDGPFGSATTTLWNSRAGSPLLTARHLPDAGALDGGGQVVRAEWLPDLEVSGVELEIQDGGRASAAPANIPLYSEPLRNPVKKKAVKETAVPQKPVQGGGMCRLCGFVGNKASMTRHLAKCENRAGTGKGEHEVYRLRVTDSRYLDYWLDVEMPVTANLDDLDGFLRGIWLECCGHMSAFTIGPQEDYDDFDPFGGGSKKSKQPTLDGLGLKAGDKFGYTYDFGSSTDLNVQVQARETVAGKAKEKVRLLARNLPPALTCSKCAAPAKWAHSWEYDEETGQPLLYCGKHGKGSRDEQLPVVNSPRMGVCGYEGGNLDNWPPAATD